MVEERGTPVGRPPQSQFNSLLSPLPLFKRHHSQKWERSGPWSRDPKALVAQRRRQIGRADRYARYQQILALSQAGLSRAIARHLHLSRGCVHRYVTAKQFPERALPGTRGSPSALPAVSAPALEGGLPQSATTRR